MRKDEDSPDFSLAWGILWHPVAQIAALLH
jgi:hypothetical protein